ncbi:hypothetical protein BH11PSE10_BH11PSE10_13200 [soil metagenome]
MNLKPLVAASLVALASIGAQAITTNWGAHDPLEPGGAFSLGGFIDDTYQFTLGSSYMVSSSTYTLFGTIAPATYSLWTLGGDGLVGTADDVGLGGWTFNATPTVHTLTLGAGSYYYSVFGKSLTPAAYAIASSIAAAPVPEPETYAMLLAGLGVVGFVASRRRSN